MGIWMIVYQVEAANVARYLEWFHAEHIPEKLARPGYDWAAHYSFKPTPSSSSEVGATTGYIALFGGDSSRVFYDPSPMQLKPTQDALTREMIGYRNNVQMSIVQQEWSDGDASDAVHAPFIQLQMGEADVNDQTFCAWCAQNYFEQRSKLPNVKSIRKLLASTGGPRHAVLQELKSSESIDKCNDESTDKGNASAQISFPQEILAGRIWPGQ